MDFLFPLLKNSESGVDDRGHRLRIRHLKGDFSLNDFHAWQRATGKIQRNNYHHGNCGPSLTGKTSSVSLNFAHGTHQNIKNR